MMRKIFLVVAMILAALPALALTLDEARKDGLVAEQPTGYVKVVKSSAAVEELAKNVNEGRKAEYIRISNENGQPLDVVAKLAAEQIAKKLGAAK
jgi:uncharacterized protein YdbL (DUF1318 family)